MYTNSFGIELALSVPLYGTFSKRKLFKTAVETILKNRHAFTLAETLITLTIIGVIAAMTVPTLMTNYTKHTYVVGLKKAYSQLQNAVKMVPLTEGCSAGDFECAGWDFGKSDGYKTNSKNLSILAKQFKTTKYSNSSIGGSCMALYNVYATKDCFFTEDGMIIASSDGAHAFTSIVVDVNGIKGPNIGGRDQFIFQIAGEDKNGVVAGAVMPWGSKIYSTYNTYGYWKNSPSECKNPKKNSPYTSRYCAGRVLEEGKMDY